MFFELTGSGRGLAGVGRRRLKPLVCKKEKIYIYKFHFISGTQLIDDEVTFRAYK